MEMRERIERALVEFFRKQADEWGHFIGYYQNGELPYDGRIHIDELATAVLNTMREPTNEMLDAAIASADVPYTVFGSWDFAEVYRKMIDAALTPPRPDSAQEEV